MKTLFGLFTLVFLIVQIQAKGQITITRSDMPDIGDTIRVSTAIDLTGIDPALTGPGYTWERGLSKLPFNLTLAFPSADFGA